MALPVGNVSVIHAPAAAPVAPGPAAAAATGGDDSVLSLQRIQAEQQKAWASLNALNPFSSDYGKQPAVAAPGTAGATTPGTAGVAAATGPFEQLQHLLSNPMVQGYLKLFSNPLFARGVDQIVNSPRRMTLLYAELGLIVFMLIFRAWRLSKSDHWAKRLWTRVWTLFAFWLLALIAVPWVVLGEPYYQTVAGLLDVILTAWHSK